MSLFRRQATRGKGPADPRSRLTEINAIRWFHRIDLGNGVVTPGADIDGRAKIDFHHLPDDLSRRSVLDIGTWDGLFSFEAERRGARRVVATDHYCWSGEGWGTKAGFDLAREILGSKVEDVDVDVMDLDPKRLGTFDLVLFLGVLYHLRHPLLAIEKVAAMTAGMLILGTWVDLAEYDRPAAVFYPDAELGGDPTNWWGLNPRCVEAMLRDVGFKRVEIVARGEPSLGSPPHPAFAMVFHAFRENGG